MTPPTSMEFFTLRELTHGREDSAPPAVRESLVALALHVLDPLRRRVGRLRVNSGWRTPAENADAGGERTSQHLNGEAADVTPIETTVAAAWLHLSGLPFDQAILYPSHLHLSYGPRNRRRAYRRGGPGESKYVPVRLP